jgi:putative endonuclease
MYHVYVIKNPFDKIYIGQTNDLDLRLQRHNGLMPSKSTSYTKINNGPWQLVYSEEFETRKVALAREKYLKSHAGRDWIREKLEGR